MWAELLQSHLVVTVMLAGEQLFGVSRFNKEGFDITQSQTYEIQATAWNQLVHTTESPTGG